MLGALLAIVSGYLVHRWLEGSIRPATRMQRVFEWALPLAFVALAFWLGAQGRDRGDRLGSGSRSASSARPGDSRRCSLARRLNRTAPFAAAARPARSWRSILPWNDAPHVFDRLARPRPSTR